MSDDWVTEYIEIHKQREREKQDVQTRRSLATSQAPGKFQWIRERMKRDVRMFRGVVRFQALELQEYPSDKFQVIHPLSPRVILEIELTQILIKYLYAFFPKDDSGGRPEQKIGTLRICSDLDGLLTVYEDGSKEKLGKKLADESEVSEFLLKPVLDYIDG